MNKFLWKAHTFMPMSTHIHLFLNLSRYVTEKLWMFSLSLPYATWTPGESTQRIWIDGPAGKAAPLIVGADQTPDQTSSDTSVEVTAVQASNTHSQAPHWIKSWLPNLKRICSWSNYGFTGFRPSFLCTFYRCSEMSPLLKKNHKILSSKLCTSTWDTQRNRTALTQTFAHRISPK